MSGSCCLSAAYAVCVEHRAAYVYVRSIKAKYILYISPWQTFGVDFP